MPKRLSKTSDGFFRRVVGGPWYCNFRGKEYATKCYDLTAARAWRRKREREETVPAREGITFAAGADRWLSDLKSAGRSKFTLTNYDLSMRRIEDVWGDRWLLADVTPTSADAMIAELEKRYTPLMVSVHVGALVRMMRHMQRLELWTGTPKALHPLRIPGVQSKKHTNFLTPEQVWDCVLRLPKHRAIWIVLTWAASCRRSETNNSVRFRSAIDMEAGVIRVQPGKTRKHEEGLREVPITSLTRPLLKWALSEAPEGDELCPAWRASPMTEMLEARSIEHFCANDLRRSVPMRIVRQGGNDRVAARVLGHRTTTMVQRYYTDLDTDSARDLIEATLSGTSRAPATTPAGK